MSRFTVHKAPGSLFGRAVLATVVWQASTDWRREEREFKDHQSWASLLQPFANLVRPQNA
jgi:hypothetical protein